MMFVLYIELHGKYCQVSSKSWVILYGKCSYYSYPRKYVELLICLDKMLSVIILVTCIDLKNTHSLKDEIYVLLGGNF